MHILILSCWLALMLFLLRLAFIVVINTPRIPKTPRQWQFRLPALQTYAPRKTSSFRQIRIPSFQSRPARRTRPTNNRNVKTREWAELLSLLQNDAATANRLIDGERRRHPERSLEWAVEKVLWQLKRDRR